MTPSWATAASLPSATGPTGEGEGERQQWADDDADAVDAGEDDRRLRAAVTTRKAAVVATPPQTIMVRAPNRVRSRSAANRPVSMPPWNIG